MITASNVNTAPQHHSAVDYCNEQIALALVEAAKPHTRGEHLGILLWEMDWRATLAALEEELEVA